MIDKTVYVTLAAARALRVVSSLAVISAIVFTVAFAADLVARTGYGVVLVSAATLSMAVAFLTLILSQTFRGGL